MKYALKSSFQIDPKYRPAETETRQVYGIYMQQRRNDAKISPDLFNNIVTQNKEVRIMKCESIIRAEFRQLAPERRCDRPHRCHARAQVHAVQ